ncbi:unnamed protein product [Cylindrotheca closterium]|uniref:Amino acid transporter transmembrane domain-containing protein n=1 Tax=Cylindrotheca closterium TaxID=2856 RepID=A0AAD2GA06_9STRA|nr:unnamed protein product [Cylindrotheca closterium]
MVKPKGPLILLAAISNITLVASSKKLPIGIPEKSWGVVGYESFHGQRPTVKRSSTRTEKKRTAREVAKVPLSPPPPTAPERVVESSKDASEEATSGVTKSIVGVGLAVASAALGGSILASRQEKPETSLIEAFNKPVAVKPMIVKNPKKLKIEPEGASVASEIISLVKAIVGVGVLSLPAGVAAYGSAPSAFVPAAMLIIVIGVMSGYGFSLIGKVCSYTGARSYREAWSLSVGEDSSWIPAWFGTLKTFLACLAFSMVLGDTFSSLLETDRNKTLLSVTLLILAPLCLKKDLKSLAPYSFIGVFGMVYTTCAMAARWLDGSYSVNGGGELVGELARHLKPKFGEIGMKGVLSSNALILVCMLSTAYMAHFNAPKFYTELRNNNVQRFNSVVSWGFGISIFLMGFITLVGFLTFGKACDGLVLNNYAGSDSLMGISRIAVSFSLLFSYPLAFMGCRDGFLDLAKVPMERRSAGIMNFVTIGLLAGITYLAISLTDVSFVLAFGGAMLGNALTYVFPAMMYGAIVKKQRRKGEDLGVFVAMISAVLGIVMGGIGAGMALKSLD